MGIIHADTQAGADQLLTDWLALSPAQQSTMRVNAKACFDKHFEIQNTGLHAPEPASACQREAHCVCAQQTAAHFATGESLLKAAGATRVLDVQQDPRWGVAAGFGVLASIIGDNLEGVERVGGL